MVKPKLIANSKVTSFSSRMIVLQILHNLRQRDSILAHPQFLQQLAHVMDLQTPQTGLSTQQHPRAVPTSNSVYLTTSFGIAGTQERVSPTFMALCNSLAPHISINIYLCSYHITFMSSLEPDPLATNPFSQYPAVVAWLAEAPLFFSLILLGAFCLAGYLLSRWMMAFLKSRFGNVEEGLTEEQIQQIVEEERQKRIKKMGYREGGEKKLSKQEQAELQRRVEGYRLKMKALLQQSKKKQ